MVEEPRDEIALARRRARERPLEVLLDDLLCAAELGERRGAQHVRAALALDLPEPLQHELEVRRLDPPLAHCLRPRARGRRGVCSIRPAATSSSTASTSSSSAVTSGPPSSAYARSGPSIAERAAARVRWSRRRTLPNSPGSAPLEARRGRRASRRGRRAARARGRSVRVRTSSSASGERTAVAAVVEDVLLHLVEDEIELASGRRSRAPRARRRAARRSGAPAAAATASDRVVAPAVDDHDLCGALFGAGRRRNERAQTPRHAGAQQRALADAARAVEHGQPRGHQVRRDDLGLALAAEEEAPVVLGVAEARKPLERRRRQARASCARPPAPR